MDTVKFPGMTENEAHSKPTLEFIRGETRIQAWESRCGDLMTQQLLRAV